ncbi:MAG: DUF3592 domain-containing protein [Anaerolineales bacterium]
MDTNQAKPMGCFGRGCLFLSLHLIWIILFGIGLFYSFNSFRLVTSGVEVDAVIVDMDASNSDGTTTYSPIYEYTYEGETYRYNSVNSSNIVTYDIGDHSTLLVDPSNPNNARQKSFWELWLMPAIMLPAAIGMGFIMILVNVLAARRGRVTSMGNVQINM